MLALLVDTSFRLLFAFLYLIWPVSGAVVVSQATFLTFDLQAPTCIHRTCRRQKERATVEKDAANLQVERKNKDVQV